MIERTFIATEEDMIKFSNNDWEFVGSEIAKQGEFNIPYDKCSLTYRFPNGYQTIDLQRVENNKLYEELPFRMYIAHTKERVSGEYKGRFTIMGVDNVIFIKALDIYRKIKHKYDKIEHSEKEFINGVQAHLIFAVLYFGRFMCDKKVRIVETWKPRKGNKGKTRVKIDRDCEYRIMHLNEIKTIYPNAKREGAGKGKGKPWKEGRDIAQYYREYKSPRYKNITGRHPVKGYHAGPKNTNQKPIIVKVVNEGKGFTNNNEVITIL